MVGDSIFFEGKDGDGSFASGEGQKRPADVMGLSVADATIVEESADADSGSKMGPFRVVALFTTVTTGDDLSGVVVGGINEKI